MKRQRDAEDDTVNKKRRKNLASDIFDDESFSNCFCNVRGVNSSIGYFTGSVSMRWLPRGKKFMFQFASQCCVALNRTHKIDVTFEGDWIEPMHARWGVMSISENIQLSLDGVTSVHPQTSKQTAKLMYTDGVMYRKVQKGNSTQAGETCFINTWQLKEEQENQGDLDWFATPTVPLAKPLSEFVRTTSAVDLKSIPNQGENAMPEKHDDGPSMSKKSLPPSDEHPTKQQRVATPQAPSKPAPIVEAKVAASAPQTTTENQPRSPLPPLSHRQKKRVKKKLVRAAKAHREALAQLGASSVPADTATATPLPRIQSTNAPPPAKPDANLQVFKLGELLPVEDNPEGWMAPLRRFRNNYRMLKDATEDKTRINIVGVVRGFKPPRILATEDWTSNVYLQDPSLVLDGGRTRDYTVNFFQKQFKEWLPQVNIGDILVLHDIMVQNRGGNSFGIGYHDRAKWAVYSIEKGRFVEPDLGQAPKEQELVDGGLRLTPFLRANELEERYCKQLSAWWKEINKDKAESTGQVYSLKESDISGPKRRQLLLLCDAGPDVEPAGYFDCTFEIINTYQSNDNKPALYVTDYTKNGSVGPCQTKWCPPGLNDYVVRFELFDNAAKLISSFVPGTYWSVRNARFKYGHNGYVDGKIVENKFSKHEPDSKYEPLQELLKRKKEWEAENKSRQSCFEHKLIRDVREGEYFNCTVELLHTTKRYDEAYLEVTDYTAHSKLSSYRYEKEWSQDLEGLIVSIQLRDAQVKYTDSLRSGAFLKIQNLRLKDNHLQERFQGELGGRDILVHRLDIHRPNDDLKALLERKKTWEKSKDAKLVAQEKRKTKDRVLDLAKRPNFTIKELESHPKKTLNVRVIARVVAYHPILSEWIHAWCSKCKQRIPSNKRACHDCQDIDHEFVRWRFRLLLRIEDRNGDTMDVVLGDQSDFLEGCEVGDPFRHPLILSNISKRLEPLLGDCDVIQRENTRNGLDNDYIGLIIARHQSSGIESMYILLDVET